MDEYYREIRAIPRLTPEQEAAVCERIAAGDESARQELVQPNLRLPAALARKYVGHGLDLDDLIQEANIGLMTAAEKYNPVEGRFVTYAVWWIKQYIIRAIENTGRIVRIPSHLIGASVKYRRFRSDYFREHGRDPSDREVAEQLGMSVGKIQRIRLYTQPVTSFEAPLGGDDDDLTVGDTIENPDDVFERLADDDERREIRKAVSKLPDKLAAVIRGRYFENKTQGEIAAKLGVKPQYIHTLEFEAFRKLRRERSLQAYHNEVLSNMAYKHTGLQYFLDNQESSVERAVIRTEELTDRRYGAKFR